jgi:hypothetical protein
MLSCGVSSIKYGLKKPFYGFVDLQPENLPAITERFPDANAVYLIREAIFSIQTTVVDLSIMSIDVPWSTFSEHAVIKVMTESGKKYAEVRIPYWKDFEFLDLKARTIKPNGEVLVLDNTSIYDVSDFPDFLLYSDRKAKVFCFPGVDTGCVLEYYYTVAYKEPWVPTWFFQTDAPAYTAKFTYDVPKFMGFNYITTNHPDFQIDKELFNTTHRNKATFTIRFVPAKKDEPLMPPFPDVSSWIMMSWSSMYIFGRDISSGLTSWYEIGKSYSTIVDTILKASDVRTTKNIRETAEQITAECHTDEEKIRTIFDFIRQKFRYAAVDVEGHRIFPNPPGVVLKNLYGDCKDLAGLSISMIRALGLEAYPMLIRMNRAGKFIEEFPAPGQFNHVIVAIPVKYFPDRSLLKKAIAFGDLEFTSDDDLLIIDPTAATVPFGSIHTGIQSGTGVFCAGFDSRLVKLPGAEPKDNFNMAKTILILRAKDYGGSIQINLKGEEAARSRYEMLNYADRKTKVYWQEYINKFPLKTALDTFTLTNIEDYDSALSISLEFSSVTSLQRIKDQVLIPVLFRPLENFQDLMACRERTHNIEFEYPFIINDIFKLVIPPKYKIVDLPQREELKYDWGEYLLSSFMNGDTLVINRNIAVRVCLIPKDMAHEALNFASKVIDSGHKVVVARETN